MDDRKLQINKLARDIIILSRNTLLVNLRFLDAALSQFEYVPVEKMTILTDGKFFYYNPAYILKCYKFAKEMPVRDFLHIVLHCIFRHMYVDPRINIKYWDLACDIAVENVILGLNLRAASGVREDRQKKYIKTLEKNINMLTAEKIYHYLLETVKDDSETEKIRTVFMADCHDIWYLSEENAAQRLGIQPAESGNNNSGGDSESSQTCNSGGDSESSQTWKKISERIQVDMETFGKKQGSDSGNFIQNLNEINREKYDYTRFLKKFATMGEAMKINDDEFDYIFYTYGLDLYDNMPLIEPLEYKEVKRIKEFVIAIDTSGSTSGELVQKFVQKTYNILKSTETFFKKINLHMIQCDSDLQEDIKITCQEEFDEYIKNMKIRGGGGTDFRPVFSYVDDLISSHEFHNLKGLIYFTDGCGEFPVRKPEYETAFVYVDDEYNSYDVPPWAIRLILKRDEI